VSTKANRLERREYAERLRFEMLLAELSARFINLPADQIDSHIEDAQKRICEFLDLDRSTLWQTCEAEPGALLLTHFHQTLGSLPQITERMNGGDFFPWTVQKLLEGETVIISKMTDLPPEASRDQESFSAIGTKADVIISLSVGEEPVFGVLTFAVMREERVWPETVVMGFKLIAQVFANALARKHTDMSLRASEASFRGIFEGAIEGIYRTSLEGEVIAANPAMAMILGYDSPEEVMLSVVNTAQQVWVDPTERARLFEMIEDQGVVRDYECQFRRKDGVKIWVSHSIRAVRGSDGQLAYLEGFVKDITDRKKMDMQLRQTLEEVRQLRDQLYTENIYLREHIHREEGNEAIVGESESVLKMLEQAKRVASTDSTVLLLGETGTGKELLAHAIHNMSSRKDRKLVTVNCASLPPTLIESELFGREKGAYTGSLTRMAGRFELADGSTLFLDEIGDLPLELQSKLLRVLEQGQFERLGSSRTIKVNVRLIAATNHDLAMEVSEGRFRKDLYYRLKVFPIIVPPLRDRKEDISSLVWSFVKQFEKSMGKQIDSIPKAKLEALMRYNWPGNIRELKNVIEHAMILSSFKTLDVVAPACALEEQSVSYTLQDMERRHILEVLERTDWRISGKNGAAEILGIKRTTLQSKMKVLGIKRPTN
jgi:formate hydrogenlyase transcriptional activator